MRPINADLLEKVLRGLRGGYRRTEEKCAVSACILEIQEAPTIEAVSAVQGRCHICEDYDRFMEIVCYLPTESGGAITIPLNHCPNCGAKID